MKWSHVALNCRDPRKTEDFYATWFGFRRAGAFPVDDGEIVFLRKDDAYLELFGVNGQAGTTGEADGPAVPGAVRHIAFQTDDIDSLLRRMGDDADVTLGPLAFDNFIPGWRTFWMRDPDGVIVEVSQGYRDRR